MEISINRKINRKLIENVNTLIFSGNKVSPAHQTLMINTFKIFVTNAFRRVFLERRKAEETPLTGRGMVVL